MVSGILDRDCRLSPSQNLGGYTIVLGLYTYLQILQQQSEQPASDPSRRHYYYQATLCTLYVLSLIALVVGILQFKQLTLYILEFDLSETFNSYSFDPAQQTVIFTQHIL